MIYAPKGLIRAWDLLDGGSPAFLRDSSEQGEYLIASSTINVSQSGCMAGLALSYPIQSANSYHLGSKEGLPYGASPRSVSIWAYPTGAQVQWGWIANWGRWSRSNAMYMIGRGVLGGGVWYMTQYGSQVLGSVVRLNEWINVTYTYDGSVHKMYDNGIYYSQGTIVLNTVKNTDFHFCIAPNLDTASCWQGMIGQVRIWDYCLSASEVLDYANNTFWMYSQPPLTIGISPISRLRIWALNAPNSGVGWDDKVQLGVGYSGIKTLRPSGPLVGHDMGGR